ncbi:hypothetical protein TNIN_294971 [Trichonephila inaurata madagascariensis]|uniref:Uncharacterized protein n=1 Tax=Trichonephila inaurata madagascariensis TaxID=2747483 RepID=A0A8X6WX62_9ARAC|nr:hypothetical protein TNIN_294971 [Trichonephila inaurata madagascariensis]
MQMPLKVTKKMRHLRADQQQTKETPLGGNRQPETAAKEGSFGFMDAVMELKKFFTDYPSLLELGKKLRQAQGDERLFVFYHHLANN